MKKAAGITTSGYLLAKELGQLLIAMNALAIPLHLSARKLPQRNPKNDGELAILIGEISPLNKVPGVNEIYVSRIELAFGFRAKTVYKSATIDGFKRALLDPVIQNIVVFAHGSSKSLTFVDGSIRSFPDFTRKFKDYVHSHIGYSKSEKITHKTGYFIKHSCGGRYSKLAENYSGIFGEPIFNRNKIVRWKRVVNTLDIFVNSFGPRDNFVDTMGETEAILYELLKKYRKQLSVKL